MNNFSFVGYLKPIKNSEKINGFTVTDYDSGWMTERLRFNVVCGSNVHMVEINAGRWKDEAKNVIYAFTKGENGNKGTSIQIPWGKRNDPETIDKVAGWRVFTVDTDTRQHRITLEQNGEDEALEMSNKKCRHFLAATEFCEYVNKVVNSEKCKEMKFRVNGNVNYTYSANKGQYYVNYEVTKIYRVNDDVEPSSELNIDFFFTHNAFDDKDITETGKAIVSGYTPFYDSLTKKNWFCPLSLVIRDEKKCVGFKKKFNKFEDDEVRKVALTCEKINGASRVDVTYDDLDDEVKEDIDCGIVDLEDAIRDAGGSKFGERIQEIRIEKLARGYTSGSETTMYTVEDLMQKPFFEKEKTQDEDDFDLFDDDL